MLMQRPPPWFFHEQQDISTKCKKDAVCCIEERTAVYLRCSTRMVFSADIQAAILALAQADSCLQEASDVKGMQWPKQPKSC